MYYLMVVRWLEKLYRVLRLGWVIKYKLYFFFFIDGYEEFRFVYLFVLNVE